MKNLPFNNQKGFTLIELLVYIVLAAIITGIAGQAFLESSRQRMRTTNMLNTSTVASEVISYLTEDVRRVGVKAWLNPSSAATSSSSVASSSSSSAVKSVPKLSTVYMNLSSTPNDSSSFTADSIGTAPTRLDEISFRHGTYDSTGMITGMQTVRLWVDGAGNLWRGVTASKDITGADKALPANVLMAQNVTQFKLRYGLQAVDSTILTAELKSTCTATTPESGCFNNASGTALGTAATIVDDGGSPQLTNFSPGDSVNYMVVKGSAPSSALGFALKKGRTYAVEFGFRSNDSAAANFRGSLDFLAVAITPSTNLDAYVAGTKNMIYYSALNTDYANRRFEFTPSEDKTAALAFKWKMRPVSVDSNMTGARFTVNKITIKETARDVYEWVENFGTTDEEIRKKARIKAIEISISIQNGNAVSTSTKVIPIINNGV